MTLLEKIKQLNNWKPPVLPDKIPHGDMPGDKVVIQEEHIEKANTIFPVLLKKMENSLTESGNRKLVITVCGGSGVGKSELASLLAFYLQQAGIGSYTLSGDNYPHRIPLYNDAERLRVFRESAMWGMAQENELTAERITKIQVLQLKGDDANTDHAVENKWYDIYLRNGRKGLKGYLGTENEINFKQVERITMDFKHGKSNIWLKKMGREESQLWYEKVNFTDIDVLVIEWTHGNSNHYEGVDIPILLNSTPEETLAHRKRRNRDGNTDSPFTKLVLELEQEMLKKQASKAQIIMAKTGEILSYEEYLDRMK